MAKKSIRVVPKQVLKKLDSLGSQYIVAGCLLSIRAEDLRSRKFKHLGMEVDGNRLSFPEEIVPPAESGKASTINREGEEIVRKDLPKETHYNAVESPNWGDSYNGTHTVYLPYERYPRDFRPPRLSAIHIECPTRQLDGETIAVKFEVREVLDRKDKEFQARLLNCLNLLLENAGAIGVEKAGASFEEYLGSLRLSWEILPPGTLEATKQRLFAGRRPLPEEEKAVEDRYKFLMGLKPEKLVYGTSGFNRYFGAMLRKDLVIFENVQYGNAVYVMFDDWEALSKKSRVELLKGRLGGKFERVLHVSGWKERVKQVVKQRLEK